MIAARVNRWLDGLAAAVSLLLGVTLMIAVVINVINMGARYGFNSPVEGADEVEIFLMIGLAFLGAMVAHVRGRHLRMDVLARRFPRQVGRAVGLLEALTGVLVCGLLTWVSFHYVSRIWRLGSHSANAGIPMWIPHSLLTVAFGLMTVVGAVRVFVAAPSALIEHPELSA